MRAVRARSRDSSEECVVLIMTLGDAADLYEEIGYYAGFEVMGRPEAKLARALRDGLVNNGRTVEVASPELLSREVIDFTKKKRRRWWWPF